MSFIWVGVLDSDFSFQLTDLIWKEILLLMFTGTALVNLFNY